MTTSDGQQINDVDPAEARGDVVRAVGDHGRRALTIRLRMRELPDVGWAAFYFVDTPRHRYSVDSFRGRGVNQLTMVQDDGPGSGEHKIRCRGLRVRVDRAAKLTDVVIPRHCLGNPRWVRFGAVVIQLGNDRSSSDEAVERQTTGYSPRLRRG